MNKSSIVRQAYTALNKYLDELYCAHRNGHLTSEKFLSSIVEVRETYNAMITALHAFDSIITE